MKNILAGTITLLSLAALVGCMSNTDKESATVKPADAVEGNKEWAVNHKTHQGLIECGDGMEIKVHKHHSELDFNNKGGFPIKRIQFGKYDIPINSNKDTIVVLGDVENLNGEYTAKVTYGDDSVREVKFNVKQDLVKKVEGKANK